MQRARSFAAYRFRHDLESACLLKHRLFLRYLNKPGNAGATRRSDERDPDQVP
jgi:hypothetical protein